MIPERKRKILCTLLIAANLAFIWGNSLLPGTESGELSGGILALINSILGLGEEGAEMLHLLIRKGAHFTEFACLGALLCWRVRLAKGKGMALAAYPFLGSLLAACTDETIQMFVDGRGSSLMDVWVDAFGALTGIILLVLGHHLRKKT